MKNRFKAVVLGAAVSASLVAASPASAATEFGDGCIANRSAETTPITLFQISSPQSGLPSAAPTAGVITKWKLNLITPEGEPIPTVIPQTFKVMRVDTGAKTATTIGEDARMVGSGVNAFDVRIPVAAGDRLGLFGPGGEIPVKTLYCENPSPGNSAGAVDGGAPAGSTGAYLEIPEGVRVPVVAVLEPDADNDGYGDETQDHCPQSAAVQTACPVITLSASTVARQGLVTLLVTSNTQAPVAVTGTVNLGKGKSANLSGGTQTVAPGAIVEFTLLFPKALRSKLKQTSRKKSLSLSLTSTATNVAGQVSSLALNVKLKGQAKPKNHTKKAKAKPKG